MMGLVIPFQKGFCLHCRCLPFLKHSKRTQTSALCLQRSGRAPTHQLFLVGSDLPRKEVEYTTHPETKGNWTQVFKTSKQSYGISNCK